MTELLTTARIQALGRINRYNGWTSRPYSVLEHTVLGAAALGRAGETKSVVRAFLLHDLHETEYGDEIRPVQRDHPNPSLTDAKKTWDVMLYGQYGLGGEFINRTIVDDMDTLMLSIELNHPTLVTRLTDRTFPQITHSERVRIESAIDDQIFRSDLAVEAWWALWD